MPFGDTTLERIIATQVVNFGYRKNLENTIFEVLGNYRDHFPMLENHSQFIGFIGLQVAKRLGFDPKKEFALDLLHDVGKMNNLDFFIALSTSTTKPSPEEYALIKRHAFDGYEFLMQRNHMFCAHGAAWHHKFRNLDPYGPEVHEIEKLTGDSGRELQQCCWRLGIYDFIEAYVSRESENVNEQKLKTEDACDHLKASLLGMYGPHEEIDVVLDVCDEYIASLVYWS
jgi:hypothetical protein